MLASVTAGFRDRIQTVWIAPTAIGLEPAGEIPLAIFRSESTAAHGAATYHFSALSHSSDCRFERGFSDVKGDIQRIAAVVLLF